MSTLQFHRAVDYDRPVFGEVWRILGDVGHGKNTLAVEFVRIMAQTCQHKIPISEPCLLCSKWNIPQEERTIKVYANFEIKLPGIECHFVDVDEFLAIRPSRQHMVWIIDEPDAWGFDSRRSMSQANLDIGRKIKQCRHYNADTLILSQLNSMIDPRGRRLGDMIFAIGADNVNFNYVFYVDSQEIPVTLPWHWAKENIFPYYDTTTIIGDVIEDEDEDEDLYDDNGGKMVTV
jgi:hypothetical protein